MVRAAGANTLRPLCVVLLVLPRAREPVCVPPFFVLASASLLYLKGGAYMTVESPTGGPNDVVFNTNGLALLWFYAWERSYSRISLLCPWKSSVRHSYALSCRNDARA